MRYQIISTGNVIIADQEFMDQNYLGDYVLIQDPVEPPPPPPVYEWYIDVGPFFDRFGVAKMAVLTSSDVGVKAILADVQIRKWVDLKRTDVAQSVAYIAAVVPAVTQPMVAAILDTPVSSYEQYALVTTYFKS